MRTLTSEFPDFGPLNLTLPEGFEDTSWHNDICPSFSRELADGSKVVIFVDYEDLEKRELSDENRFNVYVINEDDTYKGTLATDVWSKVLEFVVGYK